jgi:predicted  nucleic acid-binding Zn-ribbon protein
MINLDGPTSSIQDAGAAALEIETVECTRQADEQIFVRIRGRWRSRVSEPDAVVLLLVEVEGRRYRFPAILQPRRPRFGRSGAWAASFDLPAWLEPHLDGRMTLAIGTVSVAVPGVGGSRAEADVAPAVPDEPEAPEAPEAADASDEPDAPEADPVALEAEAEPVGVDPRPDDVIAALRSELQERAAAEARLRGTNADRQAELKAQAANQERLDSTHVELRGELERLQQLVVQEVAQRAEIESKASALAERVTSIQEQVAEVTTERNQLAAERDQLAAEGSSLSAELARSVVSREAASGESAGLRSELDRLSGELANARQHPGSSNGGIDEAEALLQEARDLSASMREQ